MTLTEELLQTVEQLDEAGKQRLLNFARILAKTPQIKGESGESIIQATGFFDADSLDEMETAIEETDRIDLREQVRQQLLDASALVTEFEPPEIPKGYTEEEIEATFPVQIPPNSKTWAEMLDEERGD